MSNLTPKVGATSVNISVTLTDGSTGQTVLLVIRRISGGFYLDFNDNTFKASGHTTRVLTMSEVDATDSIGVYEFDWNPSTPVTAPGGYLAEAQATISGTLHKTQDYINFTNVENDALLAKKMLINRLELADGSSNNWILFDDDDTTPLLTFSVTDKDSNLVSLPGGVPAKRTRGT